MSVELCEECQVNTGHYYNKYDIVVCDPCLVELQDSEEEERKYDEAKDNRL